MTNRLCTSDIEWEPEGFSLPEDWRDGLALRLGKRPRRIGSWAELALYGALQCMDAKGLEKLPPHAVIRVTSRFGSADALRLVGIACRDSLLPMPFDFLQSQPSQMLAALGQYLQWRGDAAFVALDDNNTLLARMHTEARTLRLRAEQLQLPWGGLLFGRIDLVPAPISQWQWIA